jgi:hypothetical protein
MLLLPTHEPVIDLQGALAYWGPATGQDTPRTAHPRRIASGRTPLQVAVQTRLDSSSRTAGPLPLLRAA